MTFSHKKRPYYLKSFNFALKRKRNGVGGLHSIGFNFYLKPQKSTFWRESNLDRRKTHSDFFAKRNQNNPAQKLQQLRKMNTSPDLLLNIYRRYKRKKFHSIVKNIWWLCDGIFKFRLSKIRQDENISWISHNQL